MASTQITLNSSRAYLNAVKCGETGKECAVCGKQTTGELVVEWIDGDIDMGCFPIGPECAKKATKAGFKVIENK